MRSLLQSKRVLVCVGAGGVGKTTVSASIALAAACAGLKTLVMTIDPARRLANALGLQELGNGESRVDLARLQPHLGEVKGELYAMMLDHKLTFDNLVDRYSLSQSNATRLKNNPWYQQMSKALVGVQDYMAVEKLYEMVEERDYDLVVLDTPPSTNALDFMDAPQRIMGILDSELVKWLHKQVAGEKRSNFLLRWGGSAILKALGRITGPEVVSEIITLLEDLSDLYSGLQSRAEETWGLLRSDECAFLIVTSPQRIPLLEALFFQKKLVEEQIHFEGFWVNRMPGLLLHQGEWRELPELNTLCQQKSPEELALDVASEDFSQEKTASLFQGLQLHLQRRLQEREQARLEVDFLQEQAGETLSIGFLPILQSDMHELEGLAHLSQLVLNARFRR